MPKFVPRQRKHKVLARQKKTAGKQQSDDASHPSDPNALEIIPVSKSEKEQRKAKLRAELTAQRPKISGKKRKRLDHYIDTKLRKEENLELIKKLATTKVDTSLYHSSRELGNVHESRSDVLRQANSELEAGVDVNKNEALLARAGDQALPDGDGDLSEDEGTSSQPEDEVKPLSISETAFEFTRKAAPAASAPIASFGSGLKRPLEVDAGGRPIIQKRQRIAPTSIGTVIPNGASPNIEPESDSEDLESDWAGFSDAGDGDDSSDDGEDANGSTEASSEDEDEDEDTDNQDVQSSKISNFKAWATQQRNDAIGFMPSSNVMERLTPITYVPRAPDIEPLPPELIVPAASAIPARQIHSVHVERSAEIQHARSALPVVVEEQKIMEAINNNDVVIICGSTGSGKTTQVPQFLFEAGYGDPEGPTPGIIGITQPRRVAAVSMATRVGEEIGQLKKHVGYQIRFDHSTVNKNTAIKFMTDGILLREISEDVLLSKYSAIIIDEAHERSVNTDILIGMLSRIVYNIRAANIQREQRDVKPLKLVIMSATMRISDFLENPRLFPKGMPPLVEAEGRQHPVTVHFARQTQRDYVEEVFTKVSRGHGKLPPGGMLVFLTGQNEILAVQKRLRESFATDIAQQRAITTSVSATEVPLEVEDMVIGDLKQTQPNEFDDDASDNEDIIGLDDEADAEALEFDVGQTEDDTRQTAKLKLHVLPLYSQLPTNEQLRVFQPPPEGSRLVVLATNVAETSLTIPGIRYVFDCGRAKEKKYDLRSGVQSFEIDWISKASALQRAGRAGRTGPGHCYRLYSSALYEAHFPEHTEPEILRTPMEDVVLQLKSLGLPNVVNFPFPTAPDRPSLQKAEKLLKCLGALDTDGKVTALGRKLSAFPLSPRFSRMLVIGQERNCMPLTIALVAALSVPEMFVPQSQVNSGGDDHTASDDERQDARRKAYNGAHAKLSQMDPSSDAIKMFAALCAYVYEARSSGGLAMYDFCQQWFLRAKAMKEASQLRQQLASIAERNKPGSVGTTNLKEPTDAEIHLLRTIAAAGFIDQVAMRADLAPTPPELERKPSKTIDVPYITLFASSSQGDNGHSSGLVYLHPTSVLAHRAKAKLPQYIVYSHLQKNSTGKVRMHPLTPVSGAQLAMLAKDTPLLELSKPIGKVEMQSQDVRVCECTANLVGDKGSTPWPLRTWKVRQKRTPGKGWVIDEILN